MSNNRNPSTRTFLTGCLIVLLSVATIGESQSLCPSPEDILPCTCQEDLANYAADVDCSAVSYSDELREVFQNPAAFPFDNLRNFFCTGTTLEQLPAGVFGNVKFQRIDISGSTVHTIHADALLSMSEKLEQLIAPGNRITQFPFDALPSMTQLSMLDLSGNHLERIEKIGSSSLAFVYLQDNKIADLPENAFSDAKSLLELRIGGNNFTTLPAGFLQGLPSLLHIDIASGTLRSIESMSLAFSSVNVRELWLSNNAISEVAAMTFDQVLLHTVIHLENNVLTKLTEEAFGPVFASFAQTENSVGFLHVDGNPISCDCHIQWLADNPVYLKKVTGRCKDGTPLHALDPLIFQNICSGGSSRNKTISIVASDASPYIEGAEEQFTSKPPSTSTPGTPTSTEESILGHVFGPKIKPNNKGSARTGKLQNNKATVDFYGEEVDPDLPDLNEELKQKDFSLKEVRNPLSGMQDGGRKRINSNDASMKPGTRYRSADDDKTSDDGTSNESRQLMMPMRAAFQRRGPKTRRIFKGRRRNVYSRNQFLSVNPKNNPFRTLLKRNPIPGRDQQQVA